MSDIKIFVEATRNEIDNIEFMRNAGIGNIKIKELLRFVGEGYGICNRACPDCGATQFYHEKTGARCLNCGRGNVNDQVNSHADSV